LAATVPLLATDARARLLATNTVWLAGTVATASVALGAPLAFLLGRTDVRGRNLLAILLLTLLFTPLYLQAAAWEAGLVSAVDLHPKVVRVPLDVGASVSTVPVMPESFL